MNAAQNILRRSTALMRMEDLHQQCYEVRTEARLAPLANPPGFNRGKMLTKWLLAQQPQAHVHAALAPQGNLERSYGNYDAAFPSNRARYDAAFRAH